MESPAEGTKQAESGVVEDGAPEAQRVMCFKGHASKEEEAKMGLSTRGDRMVGAGGRRVPPELAHLVELVRYFGYDAEISTALAVNSTVRFAMLWSGYTV